MLSSPPPPPLSLSILIFQRAFPFPSFAPLCANEVGGHVRGPFHEEEASRTSSDEEARPTAAEDSRRRMRRASSTWEMDAPAVLVRRAGDTHAREIASGRGQNNFLWPRRFITKVLRIRPRISRTLRAWFPPWNAAGIAVSRAMGAFASTSTGRLSRFKRKEGSLSVKTQNTNSSPAFYRFSKSTFPPPFDRLTEPDAAVAGGARACAVKSSSPSSPTYCTLPHPAPTLQCSQSTPRRRWIRDRRLATPTARRD